MTKGIDYGMGNTNVDKNNGIRYGVISQHSIMSEALADIDSVYAECECGEYCECEPIGLEYNGEGYQIIDCLDSDLMIIKSDYYTFAAFCSPCVPGAGNLDESCDDGIKTYCLDSSWFDNNIAPYPIYKVSDNSRVN